MLNLETGGGLLVRSTYTPISSLAILGRNPVFSGLSTQGLLAMKRLTVTMHSKYYQQLFIRIEWAIKANSDETLLSSAVDGDYFLLTLVWPRSARFGTVLESYKQYVMRHYSSSAQTMMIVFDEYGGVFSFRLRNRDAVFLKSSTDAAFNCNTTASITQTDFLAKLMEQIYADHSLGSQFRS